MTKEFFKKVHELVQNGSTFTTATVVSISGSASAKPGSKAIIDSEGRVILGWVGGGCAESAVSEESIEALKDGNPRLINLNLDDEIEGVGMPCGGSMDVYIEPFKSKPQLLIIGHGRIAETLSKIGKILGFSVLVNDPIATEEAFPDAETIFQDDLELDKVRIGSDTYVVIATQHKSDESSLKRVIGKGVPYIALIASRKRTGIVLKRLQEDGVQMKLLREIKAPAGLDIGATTPEEIALSVMVEIISIMKGGSGRPMVDLKGSFLDDKLNES